MDENLKLNVYTFLLNGDNSSLRAEPCHDSDCMKATSQVPPTPLEVRHCQIVRRKREGDVSSFLARFYIPKLDNEVIQMLRTIHGV